MYRPLLAAAAAALLLAAPAQAAKTRSCETFDQMYGALTAQGTTCASAHKLLKTHLRTKRCFRQEVGSLGSLVQRCKVKGSTCVPRKASDGSRVTCTSPSKKRKVRFTYYS